MTVGNIRSPDNLAIRPARDDDRVFLASLYRSTREDLRLIDAETEFVEELIGMQQRAQSAGYGETYPNAFHFVVEYLGQRIGRVIVDFGHNVVHLLDISFVPEARGKGYGGGVLRALQGAASQVRAPLTLHVRSDNPGAKRLYLSLGFQVESAEPLSGVESMIWYPQGA